MLLLCGIIKILKVIDWFITSLFPSKVANTVTMVIEYHLEGIKEYTTPM